MERCCRIALLFLLLLAFHGTTAAGMAWTESHEVEPQPCDEGVDCPTGLAAVSNDPTCARTWRLFFSECPNDVTNYGFNVRSATDVQRLVTLMGQVDRYGVRVLLNPGRESRSNGGEGFGAVLSYGSQALVDRWYEQLPVNNKGERVWGVHRYVQVPEAMPPTLTLYVQNEAVDLKTLKVPVSVEVEGDLSPAWQDSLGNPTVERIRWFVEEHRQRQNIEFNPFMPPFLRDRHKAKVDDGTSAP